MTATTTISTPLRAPLTPRPIAPSAGRWPDFIIMGAAKCGTTTLWEYLARHPRLFLCAPKEPEFFSRDDVYEKGQAWYRDLFSAAAPDQLCGEASTTYTRWPHTADAAARIGGTLGAVKLIYLMRHPVERAYSHYAHHMRLGVTMTFEQALTRSNIYLDCGNYLMQLRRHLRYAAREQVLPLLLEDLQQDPAATLARVQAFLGVPPADLCAAGPIVANRSDADHFVRQHTTRWLRRVPGVSLLADSLPATMRESLAELILRSPVARKLRDGYRLPPMKAATRHELLARLERPTQELAEFVGRDLSHWLQ